MPRIDFSTVDDAQDFTPLPDGTYRCRVTDADESTTQHGDDMWRLTLEVTEGEYEGRRVFDNLVFSDRALPRVKLICSRLGVNVSGEVDLTPELLMGRECMVTVLEEDYMDAHGNPKKHNRVPFRGYEALESEDESAAAEDGKVPF